MKKYLILLLAITSAALFFTSCSEDDDPIKPSSSDATGLYFINYGGSSVGAGSITKYFAEEDSAVNFYYEAQNGVELTSNIQYACEYKNKIYMMGNGNDQIIVLDSMFVQHESGVSENIASPRYCIGTGDYLYISNWGANPDYKTMPESYVAKFNITTNQVEKTISVPGGPEGLAVANGNIYVALNYKDSIAVIDQASDAVSYIATPAVTSYFVKDKSENLYVSLVSTYSNYSDKAGLGYINTSNNTLEKTYDLAGISSNYASIMSANTDFSKIYVLATSYDENYQLIGAVYTFDVSTKEFTPLIENLSGTNGVKYDKESDKLYVFGGTSYTEPGAVDIYKTDGTHVSQFGCGISPYWAFYLDYNVE
jgi:hypothetical protein